MARSSRPVLFLMTAGLSLAALPAAAQFGPIFRDGPPRPPANIPDAPSGPNNFPAPNYPRQPINPYPRQPINPDFSGPIRPLPPPPTDPSLPANAPQTNPPPGTSPRDTGIQTQPLPPPPGGTEAPVEAARPQDAPGTDQNQQTDQAPQQDATSPPAPADSTLPGTAVVVEPPPERITNPTAVFAGLDKITGRITSFDVAINETVQFGALRVTPRACYSRPPTETPRTDAFIDVDEVTLKGEVRRIFTGWMFASSPGLHAVEHPIYDVWLKDCKGGKLDVANSDAGKDTAEKPGEPARRARRRN